MILWLTYYLYFFNQIVEVTWVNQREPCTVLSLLFNSKAAGHLLQFALILRCQHYLLEICIWFGSDI